MLTAAATCLDIVMHIPDIVLFYDSSTIRWPISYDSTSDIVTDIVPDIVRSNERYRKINADVRRLYARYRTNVGTKITNTGRRWRQARGGRGGVARRAGAADEGEPSHASQHLNGSRRWPQKARLVVSPKSTSEWEETPIFPRPGSALQSASHDHSHLASASGARCMSAHRQSPHPSHFHKVGRISTQTKLSLHMHILLPLSSKVT